ncbi:MAG: gliding motility-associated C-terminal domain-containing protein [Vicingus serpentipes]|nr:gliding motility-associated C-terminal domain-containing protein [Vicingus serpentipes]
MYKPLYILFLLLIISIGSSKAQNLVYNGDFEIYDTCPVNFSQPLDPQIEHCTGWSAPTQGTSDYFNTCNTGNVGVPTNVFGFQTAYNGNGYCGFNSSQRFPAYNQCMNGTFKRYYREYVQTRLISPLEANKKYKIAFYISLADSLSGYANRNIGALFTNDSIGFNCFNPIIANPQVISSDFVTDNVNWTKVEGEFIANGGEKYMTIGNFLDTLDYGNDTLCVKPNTGFQDGNGLAYYYIDGVELIDVTDENINNDSIFIPNIITPNQDGINDIFQLNFPVIKTEVFNRWGQKLFESKNDAFWDGRTTSGNEVPDGTYYYIIVTEEETYKGYLQLLRGSYNNNYK